MLIYSFSPALLETCFTHVVLRNARPSSAQFSRNLGCSSDSSASLELYS